ALRLGTTDPELAPVLDHAPVGMACVPARLQRRLGPEAERMRGPPRQLAPDDEARMLDAVDRHGLPPSSGNSSMARASRSNEALSAASRSPTQRWMAPKAVGWMA